MTRVVNIQHDAYDVYIGRAGHGQNGYFGNPYSVKQYGRMALPLFRQYFDARLQRDPKFRARIEVLRDKTLGCFCAPPGGVTSADRTYCCHGQVIAEYVDGLK